MANNRDHIINNKYNDDISIQLKSFISQFESESNPLESFQKKICKIATNDVNNTNNKFVVTLTNYGIEKSKSENSFNMKYVLVVLNDYENENHIHLDSNMDNSTIDYLLTSNIHLAETSGIKKSFYLNNKLLFVLEKVFTQSNYYIQISDNTVICNITERSNPKIYDKIQENNGLKPNAIIYNIEENDSYTLFDNSYKIYYKCSIIEKVLIDNDTYSKNESIHDLNRNMTKEDYIRKINRKCKKRE